MGWGMESRARVGGAVISELASSSIAAKSLLRIRLT